MHPLQKKPGQCCVGCACLKYCKLPSKAWYVLVKILQTARQCKSRKAWYVWAPTASSAADQWLHLLQTFDLFCFPVASHCFQLSSVYVFLPFVIIKARKFRDNQNSWFVEFKCRLLFNFFYESFRLRNDVMGSLDHSWTKRFGPFGQLLAIFTTFWIFLPHFLKKQTWEQRSLDKYICS